MSSESASNPLSLSARVRSAQSRTENDQAQAADWQAFQFKNDVAICVRNLSKCYEIYDQPKDRLKQSLYTRLQRIVGQLPKQYYREFWALNDVSFDVKRGETVGVIGLNGSGKSTLLQLICGTLSPTSGTVENNGRIAALLELGSGFNPEFTGRENVFMNGALLGVSQQEIEACFDDIVAFADIGQFIDQPVKAYSSGMCVRLAFSVATAKRPDILIIDEALSVGDAFFQHKSFARIRDFQRNGTTLLFVSHDLGAIQSICSKVIWLDGGAIREQGETKHVSDAYTTSLYAKKQNVLESVSEPPEKKNDGRSGKNPRRDCRLDFINNSNLRNDIQVLQIGGNEHRWGDGLGKITDCSIQDSNGNELSWIIGGEEVVLSIKAIAIKHLRNVFVGFQVRDRLAQVLFGDNTHLTTYDNPVILEAGSTIVAVFKFHMPLLPQGTYQVHAAIASGNQKEHVIHDWAGDAMFFQSQNKSGNNGLIGVPINEIDITTYDK